MSSKQDKKDDVTTIDQFSFLDNYLGKEVVLTTLTGGTRYAKIIKISAYELLVEEGTRAGKPVQKLIFKHAIVSLEERLDKR